MSLIGKFGNRQIFENIKKYANVAPINKGLRSNSFLFSKELISIAYRIEL